MHLRSATAFPIDHIRAAFPSLAARDNGRARVYLDNPAGTQVPRAVADAAAACLLHTNANLGGYFVTSAAAEAVVERAHAMMATFLGARSMREIVIGQSMTSLTFHISRSLAKTWRPGDEILVTQMDHDGNVGPWLAASADSGVTARFVPLDRKTWRIEPQALREALSDRTRLVALNYASNLTGSVNDVAALTAVAKEAGALVYVDAVQYAPHGYIDVQALGCDFLACSSYKFFGPHLGIVWGREELLAELPAYKVRPSTNELPWRWELGTPQIELQAALSAAVEYFLELGVRVDATADDPRAQLAAAFEAASLWERELAWRLISGLQQIPDVTIHGITEHERMEQRVPTVSFTHARKRPPEIAKALAERNIFVWSGNNYALELVRALGLNEGDGVLRIGLAHYNTADEVDAILHALREILG